MQTSSFSHVKASIERKGGFKSGKKVSFLRREANRPPEPEGTSFPEAEAAAASALACFSACCRRKWMVDFKMVVLSILDDLKPKNTQKPFKL